MYVQQLLVYIQLFQPLILTLLVQALWVEKLLLSRMPIEILYMLYFCRWLQAPPSRMPIEILYMLYFACVASKGRFALTAFHLSP